MSFLKKFAEEKKAQSEILSDMMAVREHILDAVNLVHKIINISPTMEEELMRHLQREWKESINYISMLEKNMRDLAKVLEIR